MTDVTRLDDRRVSLWRSCGVLLAASVLVFAGAALIQHVSVLPGKYTWFEPVRTLRFVLGQEWSPTLVVAAFMIGRWRRRSDWPLQQLSLTTDLSWNVLRKDPRVRRVVGISVVLLATSGWLFPSHNVCDRFSLIVAGVIGGWPDLKSNAARLAAEIAVGAFVLVAVSYWFTILKALLFVDRKQVDLDILSIEKTLFGVYPHKVIAAWTATKPWLIELCDWAYFRFFQHIALTTALLLGMRRSRERLEFLAAIAFCYLLGGPLYHLFPGAGQAFFDPGAYQHLGTMKLISNPVRGVLLHNTGAVVTQHATVVTTWAYIACMPSLHIAQEVVMLWYARRSRLAFAVALPFTLVTCLAVVVLGWHYPLDVVGGALLAVIAILLARWQRDRLYPARVMPPPDAPLPARVGIVELLRRFAKRAR